MRLVGVVLILLGFSFIYYFGWKGLSPNDMATQLKGFVTHPQSGLTANKPVPAVNQIPGSAVQGTWQ